MVKPGQSLAMDTAGSFVLECLVKGIDDADQEILAHFLGLLVEQRVVPLNKKSFTAMLLLFSSSKAFMNSAKSSGVIVGVLSAIALK